MPDDVFYSIFEIDDIIERTQYIEALRSEAKKASRASEFNNIYKSFVTDYIQTQMQQNSMNDTEYTEQPIKLACGQWRADDTGVSIVFYDAKGTPQVIRACTHPILPVAIMKNVDTNMERITLAYFKYGEWQRITVDRDVCADTRKIVAPLSKNGIEVTSESAKHLVRFISNCIGMNPVKLKPKPSINRLGWIGNEFMPYADDICYEGDPDYEAIFKNIRESGDYEVWRAHCAGLRKNIIVRLAFAASAASAMIELVNALPFVFHIWSGTSGTCKTVAMMAAMSIWGNPKMGGLVKTMNTTKVSIMRTSAFLHSLPYAGDELQTVKDRWNGNFDQLIYQITEGVDRGRGKASGGVEETKTWHNSFIFTGEEPITKASSRSGSKNRVIEVEADEKLLDDGNSTVALITQNYGFAGRRLVSYLQTTDRAQLQAEYKQYFDAMCRLDTTEKQAMAMSCLLLADRILTTLIFTEETPLTVSDVSRYLRSAKEVDVSERSYQSVMNWIAKNPVRFQNPLGSDSINKGEVWGKIDGNADDGTQIAVINKDVLCDFLEKSGFDYAAVSKKWAEKGRILRNSQGKCVHQTKVNGIKASYVKIKMQEDTPSDDGFMELNEQIELPFE